MSEKTLIRPKYLVPVRPRGAVLEDHALLLEDSHIAAIGPATRLRSEHPDAALVELGGHVLLPGLINMHTHSPMSLLRGYADDLEMREWLVEHIWPAETRLVDEAFVADGTRLAIAEMFRAGTTCFNENYFFPEVIARVAVDAGVRAVIGVPLLDQANPWAIDFEACVRKGQEVMEAFRSQSLLEFSLAPHAPYSVSDAGLECIAEWSREDELSVHLHCLETAYDIEHSQSTYGQHPLERLEKHELLNDSLLAVHMTQLSSRDVCLLAERGAHVVHCPQSNLKLASGNCPVAELVAAGVNVCIGTDGAASNNNLDMLEEARFAALLAKSIARDATVVNATTTLDMMTINGAKALGLGSEIGSVEVGKRADLCAMNLNAPATQPLNNILSQVVYAASSAQFTDVWVDGKRVMNDGFLTTIDETQVLAKAEVWRATLDAGSEQRRAAS